MNSGTDSLAGRIVRTLEEDLLEGRLLPGAQLDEKKLAARFDVSRTPVREALQRLAANGIVSLPSRQAASVAQLSIPDLLDAFIVIMDLEALAANLAARRIMPVQREKLYEAHMECVEKARSGDAEAFDAANDRLHGIIIESSHNRILMTHIRTAQLLTTPYRRRITIQPGRMLASVDEHQAIVDAILASNEEEASRWMRQHVNHLAEGVGDFLHHLRLTASGEII